MPRPAGVSRVGYLLAGPPTAAAGRPPPGAHAALLDALAAHSPTVEPDLPDGAWLDLRAGGRRPADPADLAARVLAVARTAGFAAARLGVAPTPGVAHLAAAHGAANPTLLDAGAVPAFLAPLPVTALGLDEGLVERLALVGLRALGQVAALPRGALGDYLGPAGPAVEALARGEDDRPLVARRPPLVLRARRELDGALDDRAALAALAARLLRPLLDQLRRQGLGAIRARLTLARVGGQPLSVVAALPAPTTEPDAVLRALLAALPERAGPDGDDGAEGAAGVTAVAVALSAPRPVVGRQASLFDVPPGRRGQLRLGVLAARRRGGAALGYLRPADPAHPLPERRYALDEAALPDDEGAGAG